MTRAPADFARRVDRLLSAYGSADGPGLAVAILEDGKEIFSATYGQANINDSIPMARDTIMRIGSQTKQFTVLLALMLEAEGKLRMSDPVQKHLPHIPKLRHEVTLEHLASNTSGWRDHLDAMTYAGLSIFTPTSPQTVRDIIARQDDLNFEPGTALIYCNAGFIMLADVIESIEGKPFGTVLKERITEPLGMHDTSLMVRDGTVMKRLAAHYSRRPDGWANLGWGFGLGGEGGMVSTLNDLIVWQRNLDAPKVGTPEMYARMSTPGVFKNGTQGYYGLGLVTDTYRGRRAVGHGGGVAGARSESTRYIDDGLGIIIAANHDQLGGFVVARRVADIYFEHTPPAPIRFNPGRYREVGGADVIAISDSGDTQLFASSGGTSSFDYAHPGGAKPERTVVDLVLVPNENGTIDARFCGTPRVYRPLADGAAAAKPLAGRYRNAAQDMEVVIDGDNRKGTLRLNSPNGVLISPVVAADDDLWLMLEPMADFRPGAAWSAVLQVTPDGFELNSERVRHLAFTRL
ncbi:MAG TPA: serine hydrolase domain-containing protein [Devosia sp.]|nr:serine hydrolase domain-containing protein [Devosia sp.]